jgi:hypothetical protein
LLFFFKEKAFFSASIAHLDESTMENAFREKLKRGNKRKMFGFSAKDMFFPKHQRETLFSAK